MQTTSILQRCLAGSLSPREWTVDPEGRQLAFPQSSGLAFQMNPRDSKLRGHHGIWLRWEPQEILLVVVCAVERGGKSLTLSDKIHVPVFGFSKHELQMEPLLISS